jgi:hypothetical protein
MENLRIFDHDSKQQKKFLKFLATGNLLNESNEEYIDKEIVLAFLCLISFVTNFNQIVLRHKLQF